MPITATTNLYPGVNAHLNSLLQQRGGGWETFHAMYLAKLIDILEPTLPSGYYALLERSLQVNVGNWEVEKRTTKPDISVFRVSTATALQNQLAVEAMSPTLVQPITVFEEDEFAAAVNIYQTGNAQEDRLVARIELLSPANKPGHEYAKQYMARRSETLRSGVVLVEVDLLHETEPLLWSTPHYQNHEPMAQAYFILVSVPYPSYDEGNEYYYHFGVLNPLPVIALPLVQDGSISMKIDFNSAYHLLIEQRFGLRRLVDYAENPIHLDRYTPDDQAKILALLADIRQRTVTE